MIVVPVRGALPVMKSARNTIIEADSIITQPIQLGTYGPQPLRAWRPYGAETKNKAEKVPTAITKLAIMRIWKKVYSFKRKLCYVLGTR